jgi:ribosomal protein S27AE
MNDKIMQKVISLRDELNSKKSLSNYDAIKAELDKIENDLIAKGDCIYEDIDDIQQTKWFNCSSVEELIMTSKPVKKIKKKKTLEICANCGSRMAWKGDSYQCGDCGYQEVQHANTTSSRSTMSTTERCIKDFDNHVASTQGTLSVNNNAIEAKMPALRKYILARYSKENPPSIDEMRKIFKANKLGSHYAYCVTVMGLITGYYPNPRFEKEDLVVIRDAYIHILKKFDVLRQEGKIKNNRSLITVFKNLFYYFGMDDKYSEILNYIYRKGESTENEISLMVQNFMLDYKQIK